MNYVKVFNENLSDEYSEIIAKLNELLEFYNDLLEKVEDGAELPAEILSQIEKALTEKKATDMDCWDGYKKDGTKKNADGETVNNCVPVKEKRASNDLASMIRSKEALLKRIDQADSRMETSYNSLIDDLESLKDQIKKAWK